VWGSAQSLASLFLQLQGSGVVPPGLARLYGAFAALQFQGVALPPECTGEAPFTAFWAAFWAAAGACGLAALVLCARRPDSVVGGGGGGSRRTLSSLALALAARGLFPGSGALTSAAANALTCLPEAPMLVSDYAASRGDGSALRRALGAAAPQWATLQAAADDALLAQALGLAPLLRTYVPVALLAADPFQPCREGPHASAWTAAVALGGLLLAGLLGGCCARGRPLGGCGRPMRRLFRRRPAAQRAVVAVL
jgi:hypothetical protein